ncbi:prenyltransferase/squalene oxidase repeat-containing protein [Hyalangium gracile]|uniref:prenyltransferase/squalene oxidase repeat-containing protein n=1 Tax=Hyalangium gracile TaxID=394092 RepID=UPI001CC986B6|nr:prenyltransferase/squalene oxidase repeat-containing protein [Hyalangium gracile]
MPLTGLTADIRKEIEASTALVEAVRAHWPADIDPRPDGVSSYLDLPYFLLPAFPRLPSEAIRPLTAFARLMHGAILQHDRIADGDSSPPRAGEAAMRLMAMQFEACHVLYPSIPAHAPFWERLRRDLAEYAHAFVEERRFAQGQRSWREYTEEVARRIVLGKSGVARTVAAGLVELAGDDGLLAPLLEALDAFHFASRMCDDLLDWREDAFRRTPSLLLARVLPERPTQQGAELEAELDRLGRELYQGGHAAHVVGLALSALDTANRLREVLPGLQLPWYSLTEALRRRCLAVQEHIQRLAVEHVPRARQLPSVELELPEPEGRWQRVAWEALRFLVRQWHLGFGEMRAAAQEPDREGAGSDVRSRALVLDALCDADTLLGGRLRGLLDYEARTLLGRRGPGGLLERGASEASRPDAETVTQLARTLLRTGHRTQAQQALGTLMEEALAASASGLPDVEQAASLHTLWLLNPERYAARLQQCAEQLEQQLEPERFWQELSRSGPYSRAHARLRLLSTVRPASPAMRRLREFLLESQRDDGGWNTGSGPSDALSTALALLILSVAHEAGEAPPETDLATRALGFLEAARGAEGAWSARPLPKANAEAIQISRTLTSALVLQAALSCQRWATSSG